MEQNRHRGWSRNARALAFLLTALTIGLGLFGIREMIGPLTIAALLAYLLLPAVNLVRRKLGISRRLAVPIVYLVFLTALVLTVVNMAPVVARQARSMTGVFRVRLPMFLDSLLEPAGAFGLERQLESFLVELRQSTSMLLNTQRVFRILNAASTNLAWLMLILVVTYYLLLDWERLVEWGLRQAPPGYRRDLRLLHADISVIWQAYLRGQILVMLLLGLLSGLGAAAIGLPRAALLGLLAGLLALIPSVGPTITLAIASTIAWLEGSAFLDISNGWFTLLTILVFSLVQVVEGFVLTPQIMGRRLRIHPGVVIVAVIGALTIGSALLALIIVPLLASLAVLLRYVRNRIYGLEPWGPAALPQAPDGKPDPPATG